LEGRLNVTGYKYLFTPLQIKTVEIKNRIYPAAHSHGYEDHIENYGIPGEKEYYYQVERAKGGAGLLILGEQIVHPTSGDTGGLREIPHGYREEIVPRYKQIADGVHAYGTKIFSQISHVGVQASGDLQDDLQQVWAPSNIPGFLSFAHAKEMEIEDIQEIIKGFAKAAQNAKDGELDGVEIHGAHGYLPHQFLSPVSNRRQDEYGGDLRGRMRFLLEVVEGVRDAVGEEFVVGVRINADDFMSGGITIDDAKEVSKILEESNKVDYISVSAGTLWTARSAGPMISTYLYPLGFLSPYSGAIKQVLKKTPVFSVGAINTPEQAERILADGQADMVGMTRALIADPELPKKAREGRTEDIRGCIRCLQGCLLRAASSVPMSCVHNPAAGREKRLGIGTLKPVKKRKKVMVIGGGPAGLKVAEIAALRNLEVVLYEKEDYLGGQVKMASIAPLRQEFGEIARHLEVQVKKLGVEVRLSQEADEEIVKAEDPDAVVVATGCVPIRSLFVTDQFKELMIPGIEQENVISVWDVLREKETTGKKVVIVVNTDAHPRNVVIADYLADDKDREVEIITSARSVFPKRVHPFEISGLARRIREKGIITHLSRQVKRIDGDKVVIQSKDGERDLISDVDTVVWATGAKANDSLYFKLKGKVEELHRVGDAVSPRWVDFAIWEGEILGRSL
jgi:mycofactocin system FadH/OYE family oxidoreductase 2